nr:biotin-dependent carboxyltransferase family protein [Methylococcus sp. BF19-07]
MSTLQDLGRPGCQHLGVTPGGAMDRHSAAIANALVGNPATAAVLEMTLQGPRLHFERGAWVALTGADLSAEVDGRPLPGWRPVWLPAGSRLGFGRPRLGCRAYLAVAGGFEAEIVLGSRGTDLRAGFGGLKGRPLGKGDVIETGESRLALPDEPSRPYVPAWCAAWHKALPLECPARLRLIPGPDWQALPDVDRRTLEADVFRVGQSSDRMGLRLEGPLLHPAAAERLSTGVTFGTLQLPPGGQPILLGVDRQTTGGYPVLGTVASVDHPRLAQLRPGETVRFEPIPVERAQTLYRIRALQLRRLRTSLGLRWPLNSPSS